MHFRCYRMRVVCEECGSSCAVDEPALSVICEACGATASLPASYLRDHLFSLTLRQLQPLAMGEVRPLYYLGAEGQFFGKLQLGKPSCHGCRAPLALDQLPLGATTEATCACGARSRTYPAPPWLRAMGQNALQVVAPIRERGPATTRPILLDCPACGAKLQATAQDKRIVTCRYCDADSLLPEAVWRAFHPVIQRAPFYIWFER